MSSAPAAAGSSEPRGRPPDEAPTTAPGRPQVSLFFPVFNERESLQLTLEKAHAVLTGAGFDFELLVVDDGSTDGSAALAERLAAAHPRLRLLRHPRNLGYARALRSGLAAARGTLVAYTDCDEPVDLAWLPAALRRFEDDPGLDLLVGRGLGRARSLRRWLFTRVYNLLLRVLFGVRQRDANFAFKLVRRRALERLSLRAETAFIDGELLIAAARAGLRIEELALPYQERRHGRSHFDGWAVAWAAWREIWRYRRAWPDSVEPAGPVRGT